MATVLTATFKDGTTIQRRTPRGYLAAWRCTWNGENGPRAEKGWAFTAENAGKRMRSWEKLVGPDVGFQFEITTNVV